MFCCWLKNTRRSLGLTQTALGEAVGAAPATVCMWERGRRVPGPRAAARMDAFFAARGIKMPPPPGQPQQPERERLDTEVRAILEKRRFS